MKRSAVVMAGAASLLGCTSCPEFRAGWYLNEVAGSPPSMYLALVSKGSSQATLTRVEINAGGQAAGWSRELSEPVRPGSLLIIPVPGPRQPSGDGARCSVPVSVRMQCDGARTPRTIEVAGALPNYLSPDWIKDCVR